MNNMAQPISPEARLTEFQQSVRSGCHDLNNALAAVLGFTELLSESPDLGKDQETTRRYLDLVREGAEEAQHIVGRLRELYMGSNAPGGS